MLTTASRNARELDRVPGGLAAPVSVDTHPILGHWANTNRVTCGISGAELVARDNRTDLRIVGADPSGDPHDWGFTPVSVFTEGPGSGRACAFLGSFDLGHARTHVQCNVSHGLTVIAAFTTFTDGSGRMPYLSREFYQPGQSAAAADAVAWQAPPDATAGEPAAARGDDRLPMLRSPIDPTPLLRTWRNSDRNTRGISEIHCEQRGDDLVVRILAAGPDGNNDWGETVAPVYIDISSTGGGRAAAEPVTGGRPTPLFADVSVTESGPAFAAVFDHGFQRVHLHARIYLGVLVVPIFTEFTDGSGRADYFHREVFIREG